MPWALFEPEFLIIWRMSFLEKWHLANKFPVSKVDYDGNFACTKPVSQPEYGDQDFYINMIISCLEIKIFFHKLVDFEEKLVTLSLFNSCLYISRNTWNVKNCADKAFFAYHVVTWSMSHVTWWVSYPHPKSQRL